VFGQVWRLPVGVGPVKVFRRKVSDPLAAAALAEARAAETRAEVERLRALAELRREQAALDRELARAQAEAAEEDRERRDAAAHAARMARSQRRTAAWLRLIARIRLLAPLLIVNAVAVGGQVSYAYADVAPAGWVPAIRLTLAIGFALGVESIALYVNWHAHDALLQKAHATAARLRRRAYLVAAVVGSLNYAHFAGPRLTPTAAAVAFGMVSLLSPWLWGLHTRRLQHVQLLREDLVDETGAEFDTARRRAFPFRTWAARRWSIDHHVRDPRRAWDCYNAERAARKAERAALRSARPSGRLRAALAMLRGNAPQQTTSSTDRSLTGTANTGIGPVEPGRRSARVDDPVDLAEVAELVPAGRAACATLVQGGRPLSRDALAARMREDGYAVSNARASLLYKILKNEAAGVALADDVAIFRQHGAAA
jgi:hypothetical protein